MGLCQVPECPQLLIFLACTSASGICKVSAAMLLS